MLLKLNVFSQAEYQLGEIIEIKGYVLNNNNSNDSLPFILVELINNDEKVKAAFTDFDGKFKFNICSKKLKNKNVLLRFSGVGFFEKGLSFEVLKDTTLTMYIDQNKEDTITLDKINDFRLSFFSNECGTYIFQKNYKKNEYYRHCDGRIMKFRELVDNSENLNELDLFKIK